MKNLFIILSIILITACQKTHLKIDKTAIDKIEAFKKKEKFQADMKILYPGVGNERLKPILTEKINLTASDFEKIIKSGNTNEEEFQKAIEIGLNRFSNIYVELDTENRERICGYFEELMDIVHLKNSDGKLNDFMYNF